jgi:type VI secretion system protein ImpL
MSLDFLSQIGSIWLFIALAIVLVIVLILVFRSGMVKSAADRAAGGPAKPKDDEKDGAKPPSKSPEDPESRSPGWQSATASFARTMAFLKATVTGGDYRYQIPWFLVIGDPGSGKSALLAQTGVNLAPEEGSGEATSKSPLEWRFLDKGILLGVAGNYFAATREQLRDEHGWSRLLRLLQNNRPRRPIDGIVLTIAAADLVGPTALEEAELGNRAARMADLLAQAQRTLGFSFPVYVVVTKCDEIDGYASFCRELPERSKNEIFGWSTPYNVDATFTAEWVAEAFDSITLDMRRLQSEIFVEKSEMPHPEDVFLFPEELARMRVPARVYLDRLFRETAYRESFRFRGIYFTGDVSEKPVSEFSLNAPHSNSRALIPSESQMGPGGWMGEMAPSRSSAKARAVARMPVFLTDLVERKIFPEAGLCQPLSKLFLARSRSVLLVQLLAAILSLILLLGTVFSYRRLSNDRGKLVTMLLQMLKMPSTPENERNNILADMAPAGNASFHSVFLPTSYLSSLDASITKVMVYAVDQWVLTNMRGSLAKRANDILNQPLSPPVTKGRDNPGDDDQAPTSVETTADYQQIDHFISDLTALQENAEVYDLLRQRGRIEDFDKIRTLLQYLYGRTVQDIQSDGHLALALHEASGPPFVITDPMKARAADVMKTLVTRMFDKWYGASLLLADADTLREKIGQLEQGRSATYTDLKDLLDVIKQTESDFGSPAFQWAGSNSLDLTGPFRRVIYDPINTRHNPFLSADVLDFATRLGEDHLRQLHVQLSGERSGMTGPILEVREPISLSPGVRQLQLALENALNLRFMSMNGSRTIRTRFDENTRLIWRLDPVQDSVRLYEIYKRFTDEGLLGTPPRLHDTLARVALDQLKRNAEDLIAQAQDFSPRSPTLSDDQTLPEVAAFRDVAQPLRSLAESMKQLGVIPFYNAVTQTLTLESFNLLSVLDRNLIEEDPYTAKGGNFGWWNGNPGLSLAAYEVHNTGELQDYMTAVHDRIKGLVSQAEPMLQILSASTATRGEAQSKLISKWQRLVADFKQMEGKKPGASIPALESFILNDLDKITPATNCVAPLAPAETADQALDFFLQIRDKMKTSVIERCRTLSSEGVFKTYGEISDLFNAKLAGNFPFGPIPKDKNTPEASPEAINEFFRLYDRNANLARGTLKENTRFGDAGAIALQFLDQMEAIRPFVEFEGDSSKEPPFTLEFTPHFRVNQGNESVANEIIEWNMQVGGTIFRQNEPEHGARWRPGNPVRLSLRWAADSVYQPAADAQPNLRLRGRTIFFEYLNRWSLLAFIMRQQAVPSDLGQGVDTRPYTLKFRVKTVRDPKWTSSTTEVAGMPATAFMKGTISLPGTKNVLYLPYFPVKAPRLEGSRNQ